MATSGGELLYLTRSDVSSVIEGIDALEVATRTARDHAEARTALPAEAYLGWTTSQGHAARSLSMPGMVSGAVSAAGVKVINASLGNTARGLPRADGLTMLFDLETARPIALMDAALISSTRTAAVSVLAIRTFARRPVGALALVGCGRQAAAHLELALRYLPALEEVVVYDASDAASDAFRARHGRPAWDRGVRLRVASSVSDALSEADAVVFVTTVTEGYVEHGWLRPDVVAVHVSLDDLLPEVVLRADLVVVDDWELVRADERRLFGRMYRAGLLRGPGDEPPPDGRSVDGELGRFLGDRGDEARRGGVTIVNPFGMAIHDVALAHHVLAAAINQQLGTRLPR